MNPPNKSRLVRFLLSWSVNTLAVALTALILRPHIDYISWSDLLMASLLLGILNTFVRPFLMLLALPLLIFTLGLFYFVINALLLYFISYLMHPNFTVSSFGYAFVGAALISIIGSFLNLMTGNSRSQVKVTRQRPPTPPRDRNDGPGSGPVIDV
jgi:putative membrane protein